MDAKDVIERAARRLNVREGAIRQWRNRGKVPHHIRFDLAEEARKDGAKLRHADFEAFGDRRNDQPSQANGSETIDQAD